MLSADIDLPVDDLAPSHARAWLSRVLDSWDEREMLDVVQLLTSELVTNAVRYGGPPLRVTLDCAESVVRVTVQDGTPHGPRLREPDPDAESGRGMLLVDALAVQWGVDINHAGKGIWFEFVRRHAG